VSFCTPDGGIVLDAEPTTAAPRYWDGDLLHFTEQASRDESAIAAMVIGQDGHGRGWLNLRLVPPALRPWVWLRLRCAAEHGPGAILYAEDLALLWALVALDDVAEAGC
jgi:hypothetical protein